MVGPAKRLKITRVAAWLMGSVVRRVRLFSRHQGELIDWMPEFLAAKVLGDLLTTRFAEIAYALHARAAADEMRCLADEFRILIDQTSVPAPNIDRLRIEAVSGW